MRKSIAFFYCLFLLTTSCYVQPAKVIVKKSNNGFILEANRKNFFINGMNWDYYPIGTNYTYSLWQQPVDVIKAALDYEMPLLRNMGVNTIRQYTGVPPVWITYIFKTYGIYTVLNHSFGRYGLTLNGKWEANTDYSNPLAKEVILKEVIEMASQYKTTAGVLMFLLGNENNYGLSWQGAETEDIPVKDRKSTFAATNLYRLFNHAVVAMKAIDNSRPIAICNGDLLYLDIIANECKDVDVLGVNIYRGLSFGDTFEKVKEVYGKPVMFTEFGADAFNTMTNTEDQESQAKCLVSNWKEIYANAAGAGKTGNSIGGFTFQFSDGWWKSGQTFNLDKHDETASWSNGGYQNDFKKGVNNMNEEWFGICAKGTTNEKGVYALYPRAAYYALKEVHKFNPYAKTNKSGQIKNTNKSKSGAVLNAAIDKAAWMRYANTVCAKTRTPIFSNVEFKRN